MNHICKHCGVEFTGKSTTPRIYCSAACHDSARRVWRECQWCHRPFHKGTNGGDKYCSRECSYSGRQQPIAKICEICGSEYAVIPSRINQRFCSLECKGAATTQGLVASRPRGEQVDITCVQCGKVFTVRPSHAFNTSLGSAKKYCSRACKGLARRGAWPIEKTNQVLYTCQECGNQWHGKRSLQHRKKYCSRECLGVAMVRKVQGREPTSIERATYAALVELGIKFTPQHRIGNWVIDAFVPSLNLVIECQGDFYHCNPAVFPNGPQGEIQERTADRDRRRFAEFAAAGYTILELWESDINQRGAKALILDAINRQP